MSYRKSLQAVYYVQDLCLPRLAPLRLLANRGLGAGIPVLRMLYISVKRSLIDYAAPVLMQFNATQLRPLELVQNETMRIILGCARTALNEVLRAELHLPRALVNGNTKIVHKKSHLMPVPIEIPNRKVSKRG
ncbi:hypothetical protein E2C01_043982 [Portunus trituberculatus]|uniref:Uncharacterized protein n=1 Tax=Portunus trituberculatus TaxID=210409 RepID=A0A5B7FY74_PORTR|nr:hypothetical protein [Portunus trituberculatus]